MLKHGKLAENMTSHWPLEHMRVPGLVGIVMLQGPKKKQLSLRPQCDAHHAVPLQFIRLFPNAETAVRLLIAKLFHPLKSLPLTWRMKQIRAM